MVEPASLKRLGGGRWQSRDGRFTIEPQSGTWVVVDGERTDELGLPLVRGPFQSLTAAKAGIEAARSEGPASSPLASRLAATPKRTTGGSKHSAKAAPRPTSHSERAAPRAASGSPEAAPAPVAQDRGAAERPPVEPAWLRSLDGPRRKAARRLIARLAEDGVDDAEAIVRSDLIGGQPALARLAIARRIRESIGARDRPEAVARTVADVLLGGQDPELGVEWRLVDGGGRAIARLELGDERPPRSQR